MPMAYPKVPLLCCFRSQFCIDANVNNMEIVRPFPTDERIISWEQDIVTIAVCRNSRSVRAINPTDTIFICALLTMALVIVFATFLSSSAAKTTLICVFL